jgi:hypothetical protein
MCQGARVVLAAIKSTATIYCNRRSLPAQFAGLQRLSQLLARRPESFSDAVV